MHTYIHTEFANAALGIRVTLNTKPPSQVLIIRQDAILVTEPTVSKHFKVT